MVSKAENNPLHLSFFSNKTKITMAAQKINVGVIGFSK
jgi:hypothetical protein